MRTIWSVRLYDRKQRFNPTTSPERFKAVIDSPYGEFIGEGGTPQHAMQAALDKMTVKPWFMKAEVSRV